MAVVETSSHPSAPLWGKYRISDDRIVFTPRFPLSPGLTYKVTFDGDAFPRFKRQSKSMIFHIPATPRAAPATITYLYPSARKLPENLLKFYIHFSAPMSRGESYRHITLLNSDGKPVPAPFLELGEELWNQDGTRFTLLFDPGRIKRGLKPNVDVGPALMAGHSYTLVIDPAWPDATGQPLAQPFSRTFEVTPADNQQPRMESWNLELPSAGARLPLNINFPEPLDAALLQRAIGIVRDGELIAGQVQLEKHETHWRFTPETSWQSGTYELRALHTLEDLAGNSLGRPFETTVEPTPTGSRQQIYRRTFEIKK